jgi:hypothetical protein
MIFNRPVLATLGAVGVIAAATLGLMQSAPAAPAAPGTGNGTPRIAAKAEPVLLELFTSQGCSSCPPADKLAEKLAANPDLVVIARPVTYWDRLGWKDTLAQESNTQLQQAYARRGLEGRNGVYTPQLVVDGTYGVVGSRADEVADGVARHGAKSDAAIRVAPRQGGGYAVNLSGSGAGRAELVLVAVTRRVEVGIGSGENGGRKVAYANVLRSERKIGDWQGGASEVAVAASDLKVAKADRYAVVLRMPDGGKVLAARWLA